MTASFVHVTVKQVRLRNTPIKYQSMQRKTKQIIESEEDELILCTHDHIQHLKPERYITEDDKRTLSQVVTFTLTKNKHWTC